MFAFFSVREGYSGQPRNEVVPSWLSLEQLETGLGQWGGFVMFPSTTTAAAATTATTTNTGTATATTSSPASTASASTFSESSSTSNGRLPTSSSASASSAVKRAVVMDEVYLTPASVYFASLPPRSELDPADVLNWPVKEPTLCSLLRWIHSTMKNGTFDLEEVLDMAEPFERTCHAINRLQRLGGDWQPGQP